MMPSSPFRRCRHRCLLPSLILALLSFAALSGCGRVAHIKSLFTAQPTAAANEENLSPFGADGDKYSREVAACHAQVRQLFDHRRFAELDRRASEARANRARFGNGACKIIEFYRVLGCDDDDPDAAWEANEKTLQQWEAALPESITARVAHANFLVSYAWRARGHGYANTVTAEGWRLMRQRLGEAHDILVESRSLTQKCPGWWYIGMSVALGQQWSREKFNHLFEDAKRFDPQFRDFDAARAYFLLPRWYGQSGDWERAAEAEVARPGGLGLETYAYVVRRQSDFYGNIFQERALCPVNREATQRTGGSGLSKLVKERLKAAQCEEYILSGSLRRWCVREVGTGAKMPLEGREVQSVGAFPVERDGCAGGLLVI